MRCTLIGDRSDCLQCHMQQKKRIFRERVQVCAVCSARAAERFEVGGGERKAFGSGCPYALDAPVEIRVLPLAEPDAPVVGAVLLVEGFWQNAFGKFRHERHLARTLTERPQLGESICAGFPLHNFVFTGALCAVRVGIAQRARFRDRARRIRF